MAPDNEKKEKELRQLLSFILQDKVTGYCSNLWLDMLSKSYPWFYLFCTRSFGKHQYKSEEIKKYIKVKFQYTKDFILMAPLTIEERILMETMLNEFEKVVKREVKDYD